MFFFSIKFFITAALNYDVVMSFMHNYDITKDNSWGGGGEHSMLRWKYTPLFAKAQKKTKNTPRETSSQNITWAHITFQKFSLNNMFSLDLMPIN